MGLERIEREDKLYRRLAPSQIDSDGTVNSAAFKLNSKPDPSLSVDLARLTTPSESLGRARNPNARLGELAARVPMDLALEVLHNPVEGNPSHSLIEGVSSKAQCRLLAKSTAVLGVVHPDHAGK